MQVRPGLLLYAALVAVAAGSTACDEVTATATPDVTTPDATPSDITTPPDASSDVIALADVIAPTDVTDAPAPDPLAQALATGVVGAATEAMLCRDARAALASIRTRRLALWSALYGLGPDGAARPDSLTDLSWDPSHDSMFFDSLDEERNIPIIVSNGTRSGMPGNSVVLGLAGQLGAMRYVALGTNGPSDLGNMAPAAGSAEARTEQLFVRAVRWLTNNTDAGGAGLRVVTAHLADSFYFRHDRGTRAFFARNLPGATLNADDTCESANLAGCLGDASLLVIGADTGADDTHRVPLDAPAIDRALDMAQARGIPVLFVPHYREETAVSALLHRRFRVAVNNNYWRQDLLARWPSTSLATAATGLERLQAMVSTVCDGSLTAADLGACPGTATTLRSCATAGYRARLLDGLDTLRAAVAGLDGRAEDPFNADGYHALRALILLGDVYRAGAAGTAPVRYPVMHTRAPADLARAAYADASAHLAHGTNRAQSDLGTYACPRAAVLTARCMPYDPAAVPVADATLAAGFLSGDEWSTTGRYALAGRPFHLRRTDAVAGRVFARVGFAREGTTRAFSTTADSTRYDRPQYLTSAWVELARDRDVTLSSPLGGPIYLRLAGSAALAGMSATVESRGTARHASLTDLSAEGTAAFVRDVQTNPLPHVDLRLTGFEVHLRKDKFLSTAFGGTNIADRAAGGPYTVRYDGDVTRMVADVQRNFVAPVYGLAGFAAPGSTLADTLSADVRGLCADRGWDCADATVHRRATIQHANYDEYANCGSGCSGNPFDADWSMIPLGWGESHELGHNLQVNALNVHWMAPADRNNWSRWQGRAGENSNNIFPYHTLWRFLRRERNETAEVRDGHMNLKSLFAASQSVRANLTATVGGATRRVVYDERCNLLHDAAMTDTDPLPDAIWGDGAYAADNGLRMAFYLGLPMRLHGRMLRGRRLTNGFDIFPVLYAQTRILGRAARDAASWNAARASLGFDLFPYDGHATYGGRRVGDIPGNDFLVVALSFVSGLDFRPYFRDHGVRVSDLALAQVQAHVDAGRVAGAVGGTAVVLDTDLAPADLSTVATVALDGAATWPRDGFHPSRCVR
jgi:hypothetical protein